jgi:hypothetical protein
VTKLEGSAMDVDPENHHRQRKTGARNREELLRRVADAGLNAHREALDRNLRGRRLYVGGVVLFLILVFGGLTVGVLMRAPSSTPSISSRQPLVENAREISDAQYGDDWPFRFKSALLECETRKIGGLDRPVVTLRAEGRVMALNGVARSLQQYDDYQRHMGLRDTVTGAFLKGTHTVSNLVEIGVSICP